MKKKIEENLGELSVYDFEIAVDKLIEKLKAIKQKYPNHFDLYLDLCHNYDESPTFDIRGTRFETDKEEAQRLVKEAEAEVKKKERSKIAREAAKKAKATKLEQERKEFERLLKKFGDKPIG